jgi:hypothetical protein
MFQLMILLMDYTIESVDTFQKRGLDPDNSAVAYKNLITKQEEMIVRIENYRKNYRGTGDSKLFSEIYDGIVSMNSNEANQLIPEI